MPSSTGFPTKEWYWSPTKDWCWSPFKVWRDSGHFHRPTQRTLLSPFHILTGDDFHFLYVPSHSHFHFLFTVWERGSLPCQHQQRIFQRDFSTCHYFPHQVPNTNLFLRQTSATMDEWFEYLKDHYYLQPCLHHNMAVCSIRPPHPGVNWMMKIHQIVKNLNFRLSPYSVLPRWEFLTRTGSLAFSLSTFLSCYLFGIVIIIIIGMNMTLISYCFMPIIINISPQQNDNFLAGTCNSTSQWCWTPWWSALYPSPSCLFRLTFYIEIRRHIVLTCCQSEPAGHGRAGCVEEHRCHLGEDLHRWRLHCRPQYDHQGVKLS